MVLLRPFSDLHLDAYGSYWPEHLDTLALGDGIDVGVFAGDGSDGPGIVCQAMSRLAKQWPQVQWIFVPGNHDHWGMTIQASSDCFWQLAEDHSNIHWLNADLPFELDGHRFLGHTGWYRTPNSYTWCDYRYIPGGRPDIQDEQWRFERCLQDNLEYGDIVVTHMLPSPKSVAAPWVGASSNQFFVCDYTPLIANENRSPSLWIHGHTHHTMDYQLGPTRVVCNPHGHVVVDLNPGFNPGMVIDL